MVRLIRAVRPWGGPLYDITVRDGVVTGVSEHADPAGEPAAGTTVLDGGGRLLLPSFADVHVHLDSTRLGLPFRPHTGAPGVWAMMLNDRAHWRDAEVPITERVATTVEMMIARGTTRMRSYAQVDVDCRLERLEAVLATRERYADRCQIEIVAFPQAGLLRERGSVEVLGAALEAGADVVGGIDPCSLDRDPRTHLRTVFDLAQQHQVPVDIHLHEPGDLGAFSTELVLEHTRAAGMRGRVTLAHAFALGQVDAATRSRLVEGLVEQDVAVTTVAPAGPKVLPLAELLAAGVRVGLGEDGQRDYWSPYGNADMLDRTWQLAFTGGLRADRMIERCLEVATLGGRAVLDPVAPRLPTDPTDLSHREVREGDSADFVLVDAETPTSAVMDRPAGRTVVHAGRVVADGGQLV
ncbi:amidohydrolase family protein [Ornithinicoccus hortensis]|uniref:Cytosine/adenosine deaminase-related metal-dependent hydrolase n=1 Tax=Ornithinicoccus hortensis TaxID=82346 RepID=A0A542YTS6_9MICO|nr:amidohydrolase family protein [Ornithinicoccus hortensis]TQL51500.1 cytosine/adenosine deaminase-related metal-dependent hydrolase [Ornithinicoccus hortensis]